MIWLSSERSREYLFSPWWKTDPPLCRLTSCYRVVVARYQTARVVFQEPGMRPTNVSPDLAPTVSILTPAYNSAPFIAHTIESVFRQSFPSFELLVVDDGSTDETAAVVRSFMRRDPRIRLFAQANCGIAAARNAAIAHASGRFFALLDSDDLWLPGYLEEQLAILEGHPEIAVLSANAINLGGTADGEPLLPMYSRDHLRPVSLLKLVQVEDSLSILSIFRREVVDAIGGFDETLRRSEDYDFWLRSAAAGFHIVVNPKPLGLYRRRPDSLSADEALMLHAIRRPLAKLREACPDRPEVQAAVDLQLARFAQRALLANAKKALLVGDMNEMAAQFDALASETGAVKYRVASWLSGTAPATVRWAYSCKRTLGHLTRVRRRAGWSRPSAGPPATQTRLQNHGIR